MLSNTIIMVFIANPAQLFADLHTIFTFNTSHYHYFQLFLVPDPTFCRPLRFQFTRHSHGTVCLALDTEQKFADFLGFSLLAILMEYIDSLLPVIHMVFIADPAQNFAN
jgi:hypothetical protein